MSLPEFSGATDAADGLVGMQPIVTRRGILGAGIALSLNGIGAGCTSHDLGNELTPDSTPDEVLSFLYAGNERFAQGD